MNYLQRSTTPPSPVQLTAYENYLRSRERSSNTIAKYIRDLKALFTYLNGQTLTKELLLDFKSHLLETHTPNSVNSMLAAVNGFLDWTDQTDLKVKPYKIQRTIYAKPEKELTKEEYIRLVYAAERTNNKRLSLILQTLCATGIRISELQFITVESLKVSRTTVDCKGKTRTVFLPQELCRMLLCFCRHENIQSGVIFRTRGGTAVDRSNIWKEMKSLCECANVTPGKVFPHNLRHLFAKTYYQMEKDLSRLADLLGHSNICTTRIYTMESGSEHVRQLDQLGLVLCDPNSGRSAAHFMV